MSKISHRTAQKAVGQVARLAAWGDLQKLVAPRPDDAEAQDWLDMLADASTWISSRLARKHRARK